jgi:ferric-dicitrate binding protein FerR (iron transport regulator)
VIQYGVAIAKTTVIPRLTNQPQAWADGKIIATGMSVQDIIDNYEDTYGYRIVLDNPALAKKTIDGTISIGTEDNLLFMLANILNADIERQGKVIYLRSR